MDEPKIELPPWLPWATTACLAALVACLGELLLIEKTRAQFLRDQGQLADAAIKGAHNQLELERIVGERALERLRSGDVQVLLLSAPGGAAPAAVPPVQGALAWNPADGNGVVRVASAGQPPNRDFQLWLDGPGPDYPVACAVLHASAGEAGGWVRMKLGAAVVPGCRFLLIDGVAGGARSLAEAKAAGSIVLATLPYTGSIPIR